MSERAFSLRRFAGSSGGRFVLDTSYERTYALHRAAYPHKGIRQILFGIVCAGFVIILSLYLREIISSVLLRFALEGSLYVIIYGLLLLIFDRGFLFGLLKKRK